MRGEIKGDMEVTENSIIDGNGRKYEVLKKIGKGSFGIVVLIKDIQDNHIYALKRVLQDPHYMNRELEIMKMVSHVNCVTLNNYFYSYVKDLVYLNLVMEYIPDTVSNICNEYTRARKRMPMILTKLYIFQLARALAYLHSFGICHRDVKPQNLLVYRDSGILKLCDFGSAKILQHNEGNVSYICSRYYRAPELIFGAVIYTTKIDIWSLGCVMAELILGVPLFRADSALDLLVEIFKVLGTPTYEEIMQMNEKYPNSSFQTIIPTSIEEIFVNYNSAEAISLLKQVLQYVPAKRPSAISITAHSFFSCLRNPETKLVNGNPLPSLVPTTPSEIEIENSLSPNYQI